MPPCVKISPSLLMCAPQRSIEPALQWPPPRLLLPYTGQIQCRRGREKSTTVCIYNRNRSIWQTFFFSFSILICHLHIPDTVLFSCDHIKFIYLPGLQNEPDLIAVNLPLIGATLFHPSLELVSETHTVLFIFPVVLCFGRRLKADWANVD